MTIALLCGSKKPGPTHPHARSATREVLRIVERGIREAGCEASFLDIRSMDLPWFDGRAVEDYGCPDLSVLATSLSQATGVIIAAPAYWAGVSGTLKNVLDLLGGAAYDQEGPTPLTGKMVAVVVIGAMPGDASNALTQLRAILAAMGAWCIPESVVVDNPRDAEHLEMTIQRAFLLGQAFARLV